MASTFTAKGPAPPGASHGTLHPEFIATAVLSMTSTTIFTAARLIARKAMGKLVVEDYLSFATWLFFMGYVVTGLLQAEAGFGTHVWDVAASHAPKISQISWAIELIYCIVTWLAKASLLLQMERVFAPNGTGPVYLTCRILMWGNLAFYISAFIAVIFECIPLQKAWDPHITRGSCIDIGALLLFMAGLNVFTDVLIMLIPIWAIRHLHIRAKFKLNVWAFFAPYLFTIAASVCKLVYTVPPIQGVDTTYTFAPVELWSFAELASIILCTCFPLMPRFLHTVRRSGSVIWSLVTARDPHGREHGSGHDDASSINPLRTEDNAEKQRPVKMNDNQRLCIHMEQTVTVESSGTNSHSSVLSHITGPPV